MEETVALELPMQSAETPQPSTRVAGVVVHIILQKERAVPVLVEMVASTARRKRHQPPAL
jgi:hypothetical protein